MTRRVPRILIITNPASDCIRPVASLIPYCSILGFVISYLKGTIPNGVKAFGGKWFVGYSHEDEETRRQV